jgi:cysteine desulfurase/selenocysteine lyase
MKNNFKKDFPIFTNRPKLVYLDNAATTQKPKSVIEAVTNFYTKYNSNVHRGVYDLSFKATEIYEGIRAKVANFINAINPAEIIFTGNATEAINLVVWGYAKENLKRGDIIVLTEMEHNSNIVPFLRLKEELGIKIFYLPIDKNFELDYEALFKANLDLKKVKIISLTQASNVLGAINPLEKIIPILRKKCANAKFLIDAAQSVAHLRIDVQKLDSDFLVFSAHKMYGPSGIGVLWAKHELLEEMEPIFSGGNMVEEVTKEKAIFAPLPGKFEAGTGKLEAVVGLGAAIDYINSVGFKNIARLDRELTEYGLKALNKIKGIKIYGSNKSKNRLPIFAFNISGLHPHDVSEILNRSEICVRAGHHCAHVLLQSLNTQSTLRASLSIYNSIEDIDKLVKGLEEAKRIFNPAKAGFRVILN